MFRKLILALLLISSLSASSLKVAVASNVRFAFKEIATAYEKKTGVKIITIVSSSGKLTAQIEHGAEFDLFLSANMKYPIYLSSKQLAATKPKVYAYGRLVLWSTNKKVDISLNALKDKVVRKIAIPNPKLAPYGVQAIRVLEKHNIKDEVSSKIVWGESISQTTKYIYSRAADIGITAKSVVLSPRLKGVGRWIELDEKDYRPIAQGIVILKYGYENNKKLSVDFYDFIFSSEGRKILIKYGYKIDE